MKPTLLPYDVLQVNRVGNWTDFSTLRTEQDFADAFNIVDGGSAFKGVFRIVRNNPSLGNVVYPVTKENARCQGGCNKVRSVVTASDSIDWLCNECRTARRKVQIPDNVRRFQSSLWSVACLAQGTDPSSNFVVLEDDNEAAKAYNSFALAVQKAVAFAASGNSALVYQSKLDPLTFGAALTLPAFGERIGDRIYPPNPEVKL